MVAGLAVGMVALAALVLPLRLAVKIGIDPWLFDLRLAPFAGLVGWLRLPHPAPRPPPATPARRSPPPRLPPILRALPDLLAAVVDRTRIDRLSGTLRFGTGDPGLTGQILGWLMPLAFGIGGRSGLHLVPDFDRACLAGDAEVVLRVIPLRLAGPLFRFWRAVR